jgi:hypothetical protein
VWDTAPIMIVICRLGRPFSVKRCL